MRAWSRSARRRGHNLEVVVAHADGHADLEYLNTVHESGDHWSNLTSLPDRCGLEGVAICGYRSRASFEDTSLEILSSKCNILSLRHLLKELVCLTVSEKFPILLSNFLVTNIKFHPAH